MRSATPKCPTCNRALPRPKCKRSDPTPLELLGRAITLCAGFAGDWSPMPLRAREPFASWGNLPGVEWRQRYEAYLLQQAAAEKETDHALP